MSSEQVWSSFQFSKEQWRTQSKSSDSSSETKQNVSKKSTGCPQNMGREKPSRHEPSGGGTYKVKFHQSMRYDIIPNESFVCLSPFYTIFTAPNYRFE